MNIFLKAIFGLLIVGLGAGVVIYCDSQGYFNSNKDTSGDSMCKHQIKNEKCFVCLPELIEKSGKCPTHDFPLAICTFCDSSLMPLFKEQNDWCKEHDVPESQCVKCNPKIALKFKDNQNSKPDSIKIVPKDNWVRETDKDASLCEVEKSTIQFTSPLVAQNAGLEYFAVSQKPFSKSIICPVTIQYNGNQYAQISAKTPGFITEVKKDVGESVSVGEILANLKSVEFLDAKAEFLQAISSLKINQINFDREKKLVEHLASTEINLVNAKSKLVESEISLILSEQKLKSFELTKDQIKKIQDGEKDLDFLPLISPIAGVILEKHAHQGENVESGSKLYTVADLSKMWGILDVYEKDSFAIKLGQKVTVTFDHMVGEKWNGTVTWVSTQIDTNLRTLKARVELLNPNMTLKAGMLGQAKVKIAEDDLVLYTPKSSVQWDGCCNVVFVKVSDYIIEPRKIKIINEISDFYIVSGNLKAGEKVVTMGSFLMKTEVAKGSIGAGCCE